MADVVLPLPAADPPREPWGSWGALIGQSADAIFLLSRRRQLRYVNHAWETLTNKSFDAVRGSFCLPRKKKGTGSLRALLQTLAPPPEVIDGRTLVVRRPVPPLRLGPPWWEILFVPFHDVDGLTGILGQIRAIASPANPGGGSGLSDALVALRQREAGRSSFDLLVSEHAPVQRVEAQARLAASLRTPVWITGQPGTGKETLARIIHFNGITREQTFLGIDCAGLQPFLVRNMLFGLVGQTGTRLGTIYFKNPESLQRDLQSELLGWYEELDDPPRVVVGSQLSLSTTEPASRLLDEFVATFNVIDIRMPPLCERLRDLPRLIGEVLRRETIHDECLTNGSSDVLNCLGRHDWPGNLRELADVLHFAQKSSGGNQIEVGHLPLYLRASSASRSYKPLPKLDEILESIETRLIRQAIRKTKGNKSEAAELLGVPRARLLRRMEALRIEDVSA